MFLLNVGWFSKDCMELCYRAAMPTGGPRTGRGPLLDLLRPLPSFRFIFEILNFTTVMP
jgi:hypothetical protein